MLEVVDKVFVTLPVRETDMVGLKEVEEQPENVPVEQMLGVFVIERVLVWHTLSDGMVVMDGVKDGNRELDP